MAIASFLVGCSSGTEPENHAPNAPSDPNPDNGALNQPITLSLSWTGSDPEGDGLTYDVYFGFNTDPPWVSGGLATASYTPDILWQATTYYWRIQATDAKGLSVLGPIWQFTTQVAGGNLPPYTPVYFTPDSNQQNASVDPLLTWFCSDPNGDPLLYDVYFGLTSPPLLLDSNYTGTSYQIQGLEANQTYYWAILAKDNHGNAAAGPIWRFTTVALAANQISGFGSLPRWSPDGQKILFGSEGINKGLWIYYPASDSLVQILDASQPQLGDYSWSPASDKIAFGGAGATLDSTSGIFTINVNGTDLQRWRPTGRAPSWAPDGSGLVFAETDPQLNATGISRLAFTSGTVTVLTTTGTDPQYHPDGTQIAYRQFDNDTSSYKLRLITLSGAPLRTLVDACDRFVWAEGGASVIFDFLSGDGMDIGRVQTAGGSVFMIADGGVEPSIANTNKIAYQRLNFDLSLGVWTMNVDGTSDQQITSIGFQPSINPTGTQIVYARSDGIWLVNL